MDLLELHGVDWLGFGSWLKPASLYFGQFTWAIICYRHSPLNCSKMSVWRVLTVETNLMEASFGGTATSTIMLGAEKNESLYEQLSCFSHSQPSFTDWWDSKQWRPFFGKERWISSYCCHFDNSTWHNGRNAGLSYRRFHSSSPSESPFTAGVARKGGNGVLNEFSRPKRPPYAHLSN